MEEDDDGDEDDQVEANDSEFKEVVLEDDWTYLRYEDIILYIHFVGGLTIKTHKKTHYFISSTTLLTNYNSYFSLSTP